MNVNFLNQLFSEHFNGGNNDRRGLLVLGAGNNACLDSDSSISDGTEKRELKKYKAIFIHYSGEEDNGMDSEEIEAFDYDEAYSKACKMPGRLYKLTEK